jgi:hypothetical protein
MNLNLTRTRIRLAAVGAASLATLGLGGLIWAAPGDPLPVRHGEHPESGVASQVPILHEVLAADMSRRPVADGEVTLSVYRVVRDGDRFRIGSLLDRTPMTEARFDLTLYEGEYFMVAVPNAESGLVNVEDPDLNAVFPDGVSTQCPNPRGCAWVWSADGQWGLHGASARPARTTATFTFGRNAVPESTAAAPPPTSAAPTAEFRFDGPEPIPLDKWFAVTAMAYDDRGPDQEALPLAGVPVVLTWVDAMGALHAQAGITNLNGVYTFQIPVVEYRITIHAKSGYTKTWDESGTYDAAAGHTPMATHTTYMRQVVVEEAPRQPAPPSSGTPSTPDPRVDPPTPDPSETVPPASVPPETVPSTTVPTETVPPTTMPPVTVPDETVPAETVPDEAMPAESVPDEAAWEVPAGPVTDPADDPEYWWLIENGIDPATGLPFD